LVDDIVIASWAFVELRAIVVFRVPRGACRIRSLVTRSRERFLATDHAAERRDDEISSTSLFFLFD